MGLLASLSEDQQWLEIGPQSNPDGNLFLMIPYHNTIMPTSKRSAHHGDHFDPFTLSQAKIAGNTALRSSHSCTVVRATTHFW